MILAFENPENLFEVIKGLVYEGIPFKVKKVEDREYISVERTYWVIEVEYAKKEGE